tara:strand:- start:1632 stop:2036 length:405 start_codon:yes stop_codon:yes gene_type:complete
MQTYQITDLMNKDHEHIEELLEQLEKNPTKFQLQKLKFELEKHFLLEEKAIFEMYYTENEEDEKLVPILMEQHKTILAEINELNTEDILDITRLKTMLQKHSKLEDEKFYPKLDEILTTERKEAMLERIQTKLR